MRIEAKNAARYAAACLVSTVLLGTSVGAYVLLDPPRRVFDPPVVVVVDDRGFPGRTEPDHGLAAAVEAVESWNTPSRHLVTAQVGPVPDNLRVGDGQTTVHFDDPQKTCSQRFFCLAAAFVTYKHGEKAECGGLDLFNISESDIVFNTDLFQPDPDFEFGPCRGIEFEETLTHEIGHALGLGHSRDWKAAMAPFVTHCRPYPPQKDDWDGIEAIYDCDLIRQ